MKHCGYRVLITLCMVFSSVIAEAGGECNSAYENGNDQANFESCRLLANKGSSEAQLGYGLILMSGTGRVPNIKEALDWFRRSARQRNLLAQVMLGRALSDPRFGITLNEPEAYAWWSASAQRDSAAALWARLPETKRKVAAMLAKEYISAYASAH